MGSFDEKLTREADQYMEDYKGELGADYKALRAQFESGQDASTQHAESQMREMMKENLRDQQAAAAVSGATESAMADARARAGKAVSDATSQIAAGSTGNVMRAMQGYQDVARDYAKTQSEHRYDQAKTEAQMKAQLAQAGINGVASIASSFAGGPMGKLMKG